MKPPTAPQVLKKAMPVARALFTRNVAGQLKMGPAEMFSLLWFGLHIIHMDVDKAMQHVNSTVILYPACSRRRMQRPRER